MICRGRVLAAELERSGIGGHLSTFRRVVNLAAQLLLKRVRYYVLYFVAFQNVFLYL